MNLVFAIKSLEGQAGGAERVIGQIMNGLAQRGHRVTIITLDPPGFQPFYPLNPLVDRIGLGIPSNVKSSTATEFLRTIANFGELIRGKYDVAIGFMHSAYVPLSLALIGSGTPMVASEHTTPAHFVSRRLQNGLAKLSRRLAYTTTVVSPVVEKEFKIGGNKHLTVIPNPIHSDFFEESNFDSRRSDTILCPGVFRPEKDHVVLLDAFDRLGSDYPNWRLRIVGDGPLREEVHRRAARSPFRKRIDLPGFSTDMPSEYAKASFVVLPSIYESFGMALAEGFASGKPGVSFSDCAGAALLIDDEVNGLIAPAQKDRAAALASTMRRLMSDEVLRCRLASNARNSVMQFSTERVLNLWEALLEGVASNSQLRTPGRD